MATARDHGSIAHNALNALKGVPLVTRVLRTVPNVPTLSMPKRR